MTEKNIKLKDGEDILYPQTKIGNILNDDGSIWEEALDKNRVLHVYPSSDGDYTGFLITEEIKDKIQKQYYIMIILHRILDNNHMIMTFIPGSPNKVGYNNNERYFAVAYQYGYSMNTWYGTRHTDYLNERLYVTYGGHGPEIDFTTAYSPQSVNLEQSNFDALYKYTAESGIKIENNVIKEDVIEINVSLELTQEDLQAGATWKTNVGSLDEGKKIWNSINSSIGLPKKAIINISLNLLGITDSYKILANPYKDNVSYGYNFNIGGFTDSSHYLFVYGAIYINDGDDTIDAHLAFKQNLAQ